MTSEYPRLENVGIQSCWGISQEQGEYPQYLVCKQSKKVWNRTTGKHLSLPKKVYALSISGRNPRSGAANLEEFLADFTLAVKSQAK